MRVLLCRARECKIKKFLDLSGRSFDVFALNERSLGVPEKSPYAKTKINLLRCLLMSRDRKWPQTFRQYRYILRLLVAMNGKQRIQRHAFYAGGSRVKRKKSDRGHIDVVWASAIEDYAFSLAGIEHNHTLVQLPS